MARSSSSLLSSTNVSVNLPSFSIWSIFSSPYMNYVAALLLVLLSFGASSAKAGALNVTATATAMIAIKIRFIISHPPLMFEDPCHSSALLRVISKLDAGPLKSMLS